ncbi:Rab-like protein 2A [Perkinsus chesapeaki]|uniref:Rab-like protein 2A n=1 Tax=Perkinsus chesapeaki TaxID=330153 RepID=A0A7J6KVV7_PERCH|nr:Rab-like protein 2A [Perkinsus chesapeaki]
MERNEPIEIDEDDLSPADLKIILLGDSASGKSKLVERFLLDDYNPRQLSTFAINLFRYNATSDDGRVWKIDLWDTAGQEQFNKLHPSYYYKANAAILVFDITRKITYKNLSTWYEELRQHTYGVPAICVANKIDIDMTVTERNFAFASRNKLPFYFVSASNGTNVVKVFREAFKLAVANKECPPDEVRRFANQPQKYLLLSRGT